MRAIKNRKIWGHPHEGGWQAVKRVQSVGKKNKGPGHSLGKTRICGLGGRQKEANRMLRRKK